MKNIIKYNNIIIGKVVDIIDFLKNEEFKKSIDLDLATFRGGNNYDYIKILTFINDLFQDIIAGEISKNTLIKVLLNSNKNHEYILLEEVKNNLPYIQITNNKNIILGKKMFDKINEINYFAWVIGYEMINNIEKYGIEECDILYDFSQYVATDFVESKENKDIKRSGYEMFYNYINNKGGFEKMFKDYFKII